MLLLVLFALVAGAATALSPCVLPVLPALLSAGAVGGRRRPLGIVLGLTATFTITIVGLAEVARGVGVGDRTLRDAAIAVLAAFGLALVVPRVAARLEAPLSRLARLGPRSAAEGFWSGLGVGGALGFVYAPCAGPILAAVISVSAVSGRTFAVGLAYALGSAVVLLGLTLGGRRVLAPLRRAGRGPGLQRALGGVMVLTAAAMALGLDVRFQETIANHLPAALVDPAHSLETSAAARHRLADLRGAPRFEERAAAAPAGSGARAPSLPRLGAAPEFTGTQRWFNTPGGRPLTLAGLHGRVVLVDFWTYTCINCIRTLPYLEAWDARYRSKGLTIVGVHSPEFSFEKDAGNVARAIRDDGVRYPVAQDNDLATWSAWSNQAWPADYLVDAEGQVREVHVGEGGYDATERSIRTLLAARGAVPGAMAQPRGAITATAQTTPETYLGATRSDRFLPPTRTGTRAYPPPAASGLPLDHFAFGGTWRVSGESATAVRRSTLTAQVRARRVYLVLGPRPGAHGAPGRVTVSLDGHRLPGVVVRTQRLYTLVDLPRSETHLLRLGLDSGLTAYAFTFG